MKTTPLPSPFLPERLSSRADATATRPRADAPSRADGAPSRAEGARQRKDWQESDPFKDALKKAEARDAKDQAKPDDQKTIDGAGKEVKVEGQSNSPEPKSPSPAQNQVLPAVVEAQAPEAHADTDQQPTQIKPAVVDSAPNTPAEGVQITTPTPTKQPQTPQFIPSADQQPDEVEAANPVLEPESKTPTETEAPAPTEEPTTQVPAPARATKKPVQRPTAVQPGGVEGPKVPGDQVAVEQESNAEGVVRPGLMDGPAVDLRNVAQEVSEAPVQKATEPKEAEPVVVGGQLAEPGDEVKPSDDIKVVEDQKETIKSPIQPGAQELAFRSDAAGVAARVEEGRPSPVVAEDAQIKVVQEGRQEEVAGEGAGWAQIVSDLPGKSASAKVSGELLGRSGSQGVASVARARRLGEGQDPAGKDEGAAGLDRVGAEAPESAEQPWGSARGVEAERDSDVRDGGRGEVPVGEKQTGGVQPSVASVERQRLMGNLPTLAGVAGVLSEGGSVAEGRGSERADARSEIWSLAGLTGKVGGPSASGVAGKGGGLHSGGAGAPVEQQLAEGMSAVLRHIPSPSGQRVVTMRLEPLELGSVRVQMRVAGDAVSLHFQVGTKLAQAAVSKSVQELRQSVERRGLRVAGLTVELDAGLAPQVPPAGAGSVGTPIAGGVDAGVSAEREPGVSARPATGGDGEGGVLETLTLRLDQVA